MNIPTDSYRLRFLLVYPILSGYALAACVVAGVLLTVGSGVRFGAVSTALNTILTLSVTTNFIVLPTAILLAYTFRVAVSPQFIWCLDLRGNMVPVTWGSIRSVRKSIIPGFPAFVLESCERRKRLFVPRFLTRYEEFVARVEEYGGDANPLYRMLWPTVEQPH